MCDLEWLEWPFYVKFSREAEERTVIHRIFGIYRKTAGLS